MWIDITDLESFYESGLGIFTKDIINQTLLDLWPEVKGQRILGLGYVPPYFQKIMKDTDDVVAAMPSYQGASPWPNKRHNKTVLVHEHHLPFRDDWFTKALLVHVMGYTVHIKEMLQEIWRVVESNGEVIIIVPNRLGFWSHMETSPYGKSMPYTVLQLKQTLMESGFTPVQTRKALYTPPLQSSKILKVFSSLEPFLQKGFGFAPGVILMKAIKQVYAPVRRKPLPNWARALAPQ